MGFLNKLLGEKKKTPISLIEFVKLLASWAADVNAIRRNVETTPFPDNVKKELRNEIIYLRVFAVETAVGFSFSETAKETIMEKFYDLLLRIFDGIQAYLKSDEDLRKIVEAGLDRTIGEYWFAVRDKTCQGNPPLAVGKAFSGFCGYPNDYDITTLGTNLFDTSVKTIMKIISEHEVQV